MEKAKKMASDFVSGGDSSKTSGHKTMNAPVTEEHVHSHQHENVTQAVDKDVHQDHYRTVVQPLHQKEQRGEKHIHNTAPVEHREFDHRNEEQTRAKLGHEASRFKDSSVAHDTTHSREHMPTVTGEHVHHHVHENIQPVIHKEVHDPTVVHTTKPIHETHHLSSVHHDTQTLPAKTVEEFTAAGGVLEGRGSSKLTEGSSARPAEGVMSHSTHHHPENLGAQSRAHEGSSSVPSHTKTAGADYGRDDMRARTGLGQSAGTSTTTSTTTGQRHAGTGSAGTTAGLAAGAAGTTAAASAGSGLGQRDHTLKKTMRDNDDVQPSTTGLGTSASKTTSSGSTGSKPSLMSRLNPFTDADGDGKKGLMD